MIRKLDVNHMPKLITSPRAAFKKEVKHAELLTAQCTSRCLMAGMLDDDAEPDVDPEDGIALLAQLAGRAAPMTTPGGSGSTSGGYVGWRGRLAGTRRRTRVAWRAAVHGATITSRHSWAWRERPGCPSATGL